MLSRKLWLYLDVVHFQKLKTWLLTTNITTGDHLAIIIHVKKVTAWLGRLCLPGLNARLALQMTLNALQSYCNDKEHAQPVVLEHSLTCPN